MAENAVCLYYRYYKVAAILDSGSHFEYDIHISCLNETHTNDQLSVKVVVPYFLLCNIYDRKCSFPYINLGTWRPSWNFCGHLGH